MAGQVWIPGATRLTPSYGGGSSDYPGTAPRAVAHTTECPSGPHGGERDYWFWQMVKILRGKSAEPQIVYDPVTDKLGQFFPLDQTGRALQNDGSHRTNRVGRVCIQIEFVAYAAHPFTRYWTPGVNFQSMMRAIGSWGIGDVWPSGEPPAYPTEHDERSRDIWYSRGGWYGHSQVPANSHGDPGAINDHGEFFAAQRGSRADWPNWRKYPGRDRIGTEVDSVANLLIKSSLIVHMGPEGFRGDVTRAWDKATDTKLEEFKSRHKDLANEDGVGEKTWKALGHALKDAPDFPGADAFTTTKNAPVNLRGQAALVLQGFGKPMDGTISRKWTPDATRALRRFQLSEPDLSGDADGAWGPRTWEMAFTDAT